MTKAEMQEYIRSIISAEVENGFEIFACLKEDSSYNLKYLRATDDLINNTESTISTSYVDIKIEEYRDGDPYTEVDEHVMPGEDVPLNAVVHNLGIDCYIRAKITYTIGTDSYNAADYITGEYTNWSFNDNYYYYNFIVPKDDVVSLFDNIHIPEDLNVDYSNERIVVHILVEAIQAKNFDNNWDDVVIEKAIDRSYSIDSEGKSEIIYENNADQYIQLENGFFDNLGELLPGDSLSDKITIYNSSNNRIKYYLSVGKKSLSDEEIELLDHVHVTIKNGKGNILKEGKLADINKLLLGTYNHGDQEDITFDISIPPDLDNNFSKIATKIVWIFSVDEESNNPNTWDLKYDLSITLFLFSAAGLIIVMFLAKQEEDNIEKSKLEKRRKK